jgi:hypothetical protein
VAQCGFEVEGLAVTGVLLGMHMESAWAWQIGWTGDVARTVGADGRWIRRPTAPPCRNLLRSRPARSAT